MKQSGYRGIKDQWTKLESTGTRRNDESTLILVMKVKMTIVIQIIWPSCTLCILVLHTNNWISSVQWIEYYFKDKLIRVLITYCSQKFYNMHLSFLYWIYFCGWLVCFHFYIIVDFKNTYVWKYFSEIVNVCIIISAIYKSMSYNVNIKMTSVMFHYI